MTTNTDIHELEPYQVHLAPGIDPDLWLKRLRDMDAWDSETRHESHSAKVDLVRHEGVAYAIKTFPRQKAWKDRIDQKRGSRGKRSLAAAIHLHQNQIGTPAPIACLEHWDGGALNKDLLITEWLDESVSFKDALIEAYTTFADSPHVMGLLQLVAQAIRAMHEAGLAHGDLGNQNILLKRSADGGYEAPTFIDLNRAKIITPLPQPDRAYDLSRIHLPSDLLRIFREMYFNQPAPKAFIAAENRYRRRFGWHTATRKYRHPIRTWKNRHENNSDYPQARDLWIWDPRSAQAIGALRGSERRKNMHKPDMVRIAVQSLAHGIPIYRCANQLLKEAYGQRIEMKDRFAIALHEDPNLESFEEACLEELGPVHLFVRFYGHENEARWKATAQRIRRLKEAGHGISIGLVQDRRMVKDPARWESFVTLVFNEASDALADVQVGQVLNRKKWGIWKLEEYRRMLEICVRAAERHPQIRLMGPSVIDFEPHYLIGALSALPETCRLSAISHLMYVDRRGAPENRQSNFSTLEKLALMRAVAATSDRTEDRLVVSETNWPVDGAGIWSPICSPYLNPGQNVAGGVDERTYGFYMIRYFLIALCSGLAHRVCWWRLSAKGFGLVDDQAEGGPRKRASYFMFKRFCHLMYDASFTDYDAPREGLHVYRFDHPERGTFAIAYAEERAEDRTLALAFDRIEDATGDAIRDFNGELPANGEPFTFFEQAAS